MRSFARKSLYFDCLNTLSGSCFADPLPPFSQPDWYPRESDDDELKRILHSPKTVNATAVCTSPRSGKEAKTMCLLPSFLQASSSSGIGPLFSVWFANWSSSLPPCPPLASSDASALSEVSPNGIRGKSEGMQRWNNVLHGDVLISQICLWSSIIIFQTRAFPLKRLQISGQDTCFCWHQGKRSGAALTSKRHH